MIDILTFNLNHKRYGIEIKCIEKLVKLSQYSKFDSLDKNITGLFSFNESVIKLINFKKVLSLQNTKILTDSNIIITKLANDRVGIIVDSIDEIIEKNDDEIFKTNLSNSISGAIKINNEIVCIIDSNNLTNYI